MKTRRRHSRPESLFNQAALIPKSALIGPYERAVKSNSCALECSLFFNLRRSNARANCNQEKVIADMVEDCHAGPMPIMKRLNRDAQMSGAKRMADDLTRREGVPSNQQVRNFLHNRKRPVQAQQQVHAPEHSGQSPVAPGTPVQPIGRVCDLYNFGSSIKLPPLVSQMNREELWPASL